ncbi:MAG: lamin tail domain-containing protein [Planctomycetes bacterium]|nr:lamin tail domain-containing protein [Planctomycetota bacterium]
MRHVLPVRHLSMVLLLALCPAGRAGQPADDLAVNEILAWNYAYDVNGFVVDLVEIVNEGAAPIALGTEDAPVYLTRDPYGDPRWWWPFPRGTVLAAGESLTVACGFGGGGGLRANFALDEQGGIIAIIAGPEPRIIDLVRYPAQFENIAYARFRQPDDSHVWRYTRRPTFFFEGTAVCAPAWDPLPQWSLYCTPLESPCPLSPENVVDEGFIPDIDAVDYRPAVPRATDDVVVTALLPMAPAYVEMDLHYVPVSPAGVEGAVETLPMEDDGSGDGLWSGTIPAHPAGTTIRFWLTSRWMSAGISDTCEDREPKIDHDPPYNLYTVENRGPGGIRINEFLYENGTIRSREGYFDPWIEIYNPGDEDVDVAGLYLTRNPRQPFNWKFPEGQPDLTTIPAKEHILVWMSGRGKPAGYPELHCRFRAGRDSRVYIANEKGVFDGLDWRDDPPGATTCGIRDDEQDPDISIGRVPDGSDTVARILEPSPALPNPAGPAPVLHGIRPAPDETSCLVPCAAPRLVADGEGFDPIPRVFIDDSLNPWIPNRQEVQGVEALPGGSLSIPLGGRCWTEGAFVLWIQRDDPSGAVAAKTVVRCAPQVTARRIAAGTMTLDVCGFGRIASVAVDGMPVLFAVDPAPDARPEQISFPLPGCTDGGGAVEIVDEYGWNAAAPIPPCASFVRGDVNADGIFDLGDAVAGLSFLFAGGAVDCVDAVDFDDDGWLVLSDPIALLNYIFASGPPPAAPFPACGPDAGGDDLSCWSFPACP